MTVPAKFDKKTVRGHIRRNNLATADSGDIALGLSIFYRTWANAADIQLIEEVQRELSTQEKSA